MPIPNDFKKLNLIIRIFITVRKFIANELIEFP